MKTIRTYFLLADETEARILENTGVGRGIFQVSHRSTVDAGGTPAHFADQPGSGHGGTGQARHGIDPVTSQRENARSRFSAYLVDLIVDAKADDKFDRFVLCASPQLLGELRAKFDGKVEIYADLDKNLVNIATDDLPKHITGIVAI